MKRRRLLIGITRLLLVVSWLTWAVVWIHYDSLQLRDHHERLQLCYSSNSLTAQQIRDCVANEDGYFQHHYNWSNKVEGFWGIFPILGYAIVIWIRRGFQEQQQRYAPPASPPSGP